MEIEAVVNTNINDISKCLGNKMIFLCGSQYDEGSVDDKRNKLKSLLQSDDSNKVIILEEFFSRPEAYSKIAMRNLVDVESFTACLSDVLIIIHESISTAAELGLLGVNLTTSRKLILLYPDVSSVEENKLSLFMELAFFPKNEEWQSILEEKNVITFTPRIKKYPESNDRYSMHTFFQKNISEDSSLIKNIRSRIEYISSSAKQSIVVDRLKYSRVRSDQEYLVEYNIVDGIISIYVSIALTKKLLFSLLTEKDVSEKINGIVLSDLIEILTEGLKQVLCNTIRELSSDSFTKCEIVFKGLGVDALERDATTNSVRKLVGLFILLAHKMNILDRNKKKKYKLKRSGKEKVACYKKLLIKRKQSAFTLMEEGLVGD